MTAPENATVPSPDDPALLGIDGPVATITLNRPAAFNAIDLSIARKLEQLAAQIESSDDIRVLVIEGAAVRSAPAAICRPLGLRPRPTPSRRSSENC